MTWPILFEHISPLVPPVNHEICMRAVQDLAICEEPPSSNRGPRIDQYVKRAGSPLGSYWCAAWTTAVWEDAGASVPAQDRASCDVLVDWAMKRGAWVPNDPVARDPKVREGSMVIYTNHSKLPGSTRLDATHVGIVVRVMPYLISLEGNAAFGGVFSTNGEAVVLRRVDPRNVYGFITPQAK